METVAVAYKDTWQNIQYWQFLDHYLAQDGELDSVILTCPFQFEIVYDSMF